MHETYERDRLHAEAPATIPRIGIIGGGQLAKMTAMAGLALGCDIVVLERNPFGPAANLATHLIVGDWDDPLVLADLAARVDVITLENEFVDAGSLAGLAASGRPLFPTARTLALVQDKLRQKETLAAAGLPVPVAMAVATEEAAAAATNTLGFPCLLKARRNAYDGKGNATLRTLKDLPEAWARLGGNRGRGLFMEAFCPFTAELAVMITRAVDGHVAIYPVAETVQRDHVCHLVRVPASVSPAIASRASDLARRAVESIEGVGTLGVELFLTADGDLLINEVAPRVHNSGHYTVEACECSQFENHVRAVMGWPLGATSMRAPAAVMINLLGAGQGPGQPSGLSEALRVPGAHVHLYGKALSGPGRKMGHVTALGPSIMEAERTAEAAARAIVFGLTV